MDDFFNNNESNIIDQQDIDANKGMGILMSLFYFLFFLPLVIESQKSSQYLRFRANQSLVLFIAGVACQIIAKIPLIGFVGVLASLVVGVLGIINLVNACMGNTKPTPLIGTIKIL